MSDLEPDTWNSREFPVLRAIARVMEENDPGFGARLTDVEAASGLDRERVHRAVRALEDARLIEVDWMNRGSKVTAMSGEARVRVGQWPSEESALDRMIAALDAIADHTEDPEEKSKIRAFGKWLGAGATTVGLQVAAAAITGQLPH